MLKAIGRKCLRRTKAKQKQKKTKKKLGNRRRCTSIFRLLALLSSVRVRPRPLSVELSPPRRVTFEVAICRNGNAAQSNPVAGVKKKEKKRRTRPEADGQKRKRPNPERRRAVNDWNTVGRRVFVSSWNLPGRTARCVRFRRGSPDRRRTRPGGRSVRHPHTHTPRHRHTETHPRHRRETKRRKKKKKKKKKQKPSVRRKGKRPPGRERRSDRVPGMEWCGPYLFEVEDRVAAAAVVAELVALQRTVLGAVRVGQQVVLLQN